MLWKRNWRASRPANRVSRTRRPAFAPVKYVIAVAIGEGATLDDAVDHLLAQLGRDVAVQLYAGGAIGSTLAPDAEGREAQVHAVAQLIAETSTATARRALIDIRVSCANHQALDDELDHRKHAHRRAPM